MTREEFCKKIVTLRKSSGVKMIDICLLMGVMPPAIYRMEAAKYSFSIDNLFVYLIAIDYRMHVIYNNTKFYFKNREIFAKFLKKTREELGISQRNFAKKIGVSVGAITSIEYEKTNTSIDIILSILNELGAVIIFKKNKYGTKTERINSYILQIFQQQQKKYNL